MPPPDWDKKNFAWLEVTFDGHRFLKAWKTLVVRCLNIDGAIVHMTEIKAWIIEKSGLAGRNQSNFLRP